MAKFDLIGKIFNRLTVIKYVGNNKYRHRLWLCMCICGNETIVSTNSLSTGNTKSCGCLAKEVDRKGPKAKLEYGKSSFNALLFVYKRNAEKRNLEFSLTDDEFRELTSSNCHYCDEEPHSYTNHPSYNGYYTYNGIDRMDNSIGYTLENCVPCCKICNSMKNVYGLEIFLNHISKIYEYQRNKDK